MEGRAVGTASTCAVTEASGAMSLGSRAGPRRTIGSLTAVGRSEWSTDDGAEGRPKSMDREMASTRRWATSRVGLTTIGSVDVAASTSDCGLGGGGSETGRRRRAGVCSR